MAQRTKDTIEQHGKVAANSLAAAPPSDRKRPAFWRRVVDLSAPIKRLGVAFLSQTHFTAWATLHTKQQLKVDLSSPVGRSIWFRGRYEPQVEAHLRRMLTPGDVFVDVGANVGYFTVIAAQIVGPAGTVHAFEPDERSLSLLRASLKANRLANVRANVIALWSETANLQFVPERQSAVSHVDIGRHAENRVRTRSVQADTLDRYMKAFPDQSVKAVKIDAEGADLAVLTGMREILSHDSPAIIVEVVDWALARCGHTAQDLIRYLNGFGYSAHDLDGRVLQSPEEAIKRLRTYFVSNLVFEKF